MNYEEFWDAVAFLLIQHGRGSGIVKPSQVAGWASELANLREEGMKNARKPRPRS